MAQDPLVALVADGRGVPVVAGADAGVLGDEPSSDLTVDRKPLLSEFEREDGCSGLGVCRCHCTRPTLGDEVALGPGQLTDEGEQSCHMARIGTAPDDLEKVFPDVARRREQGSEVG
ncbi:MAG: hypothetical protein V9F04_06045 [Dermatophilaceae bacterium]